MKPAPALLLTLAAAALADPRAELDRYNVAWSTPSADSAGSMPIGNGEVGLNVWVEPQGELRCYIARTDAWSECGRLLKLGGLRLRLTPNPFTAAGPFRQELRLREGRIEIVAGEADHSVRLTVFVDAAQPVVHIVGDADAPVSVQVQLERWRTERRVLEGSGGDAELASSWTMRDAPAGIEVSESPDVLLDASGAVAWHHRNEQSVVPLTLRHQGLEDAPGAFDPLLHRTFGGYLTGTGFERMAADTLATPSPVRRFELRLATHTAQVPAAEQWLAQVQDLHAAAPPVAAAQAATAKWWDEFWSRSWIFVEGDPAPTTRPAATAADHAPPSRVTQAYILQRWIQACAGRGQYPIKFNGSIFTVDPRHAGGPDFNPDWRRWGDCYWWQNTRLPYHPMLAAGDFDMLAPLFRLYESAAPLCAARAQAYHRVAGVYFPETMTIFGAYANGDYGWDRTGHTPADVLCPWWQYAWNQGPELVALMLDYWDYTRDERFLRESALPMAAAVLEYFDTRFARNASGRLVIKPTQAVETHWHKVVNDAPAVAGLHTVLTRLRSLPESLTRPAERAAWDRLHAALPGVPVHTVDGVHMLAAAERFDPSRQNVETPELYAVFPYRLAGLGRPLLAEARAAYERRHDRMTNGWSQDGQFAALLGLADEARENLLAKVANGHPRFRFPAMWGPNFDWLPDQDHGSNLLHTLQCMLLQPAGDELLILPAWPEAWNVSFRLHAPNRTVVECEYRNGQIERLVVTPQRAAKVCTPG